MQTRRTGTKGRREDGRLGLPPLAGHGPLTVSLVVDSLGDGLFVPFAIVYFLATTSMSVQVIGAGLTIAGLLALPSTGVAGVAMDRFSPAAVVIGGNLVSAAAFGGYLVVSAPWQLVLFALLGAGGSRAFWTANLGLVGDAFTEAERTRWFAFQRATRNAGYGLGGLLGAAALGFHGGYRLLAAVNAASYLLAAALVFTWSRRRAVKAKPMKAEPAKAKPAGPAGKEQAKTERAKTVAAAGAEAARGGGFGAALRDRAFMRLAAANFMFVICMLSLDTLLTVYLVRDLGEPVWLSGLLFAANTVGVAAGQTVVSRAVETLRPHGVLRVAAVVWAGSFAVFWAADGVPRAAGLALAIGAMAVFTAAELIQGPILNAQVVAIAPDAARGRYLAVYQLSWALGTAATPGLLTWLYGIGAGWPWAVLMGICAACALILRGGAPTRR